MWLSAEALLTSSGQISHHQKSGVKILSETQTEFFCRNPLKDVPQLSRGMIIICKDIVRLPVLNCIFFYLLLNRMYQHDWLRSSAAAFN